VKKHLLGYTGVLFIGLATALLYTAPLKSFRRIGIGLGVLGGFLAGYVADFSQIRGDNQ